MLALPPRPHLNRMSASELVTVVTCGVRVLLDSNRTMDIITAEEMTAQAQLPFLLEQGVFDSEYARGMLEEQPSLESMDLEVLRELAPDTFGYAVARFFDSHGLSPGFYAVPAQYTEDPDAAYLMQRIRQSHDMWHVLFGLNVDGHEEILLHAFSLAQTGLPASIALIALGSIKHMLLEARFGCFRDGLAEAYRRGRRAKPLIGVRWEQYFDRPLAEVRREFDISPWTHEDRAATSPWRWRGPRRAA